MSNSQQPDPRRVKEALYQTELIAPRSFTMGEPLGVAPIAAPETGTQATVAELAGLVIPEDVPNGLPVRSRPGSSWSNPLWHGKWRIYAEYHAGPIGTEWAFVHDDFDGADDGGDRRCGYAPTLKEALRLLAQMDDYEGAADCDNHTPAPEGFIQWQDWAQRMSKAHTQRQCQGCGKFAIWEPKA